MNQKRIPGPLDIILMTSCARLALEHHHYDDAADALKKIDRYARAMAEEQSAAQELEKAG